MCYQTQLLVRLERAQEVEWVRPREIFTMMYVEKAELNHI